jgi:subtilase family serine protease
VRDRRCNTEFDLDTLAIHTVAPRANIVVVVADSCASSDLGKAIATAISLHPAVISMSFGKQEVAGSPPGPSALTDTAGITYVASADDHGAGLQETPDPGDGQTALQIHGMSGLAANPLVVQVGGTVLKLDATGRAVGQEVAWGEGPDSDIEGGTGGGPSMYYARPAYQADSPAVQQFLAQHADQIPPHWRQNRLGPDVPKGTTATLRARGSTSPAGWGRPGLTPS